MGAANSKVEEDRALQLCRERKKFVRQALDGRCSLAAAHVIYVQSLKKTGMALRQFVEPEAPFESSLYTSTSATPEQAHALTDKSISQFSFSSPSRSQNVDVAENFSPSPSPPYSAQFHVNHMRFRGSLSRKVEEKPTLQVTGTVTSSSTPQTTTPRSVQRPETPPSEAHPHQSENPPWDFFGLFPPTDNQFSFQEGGGFNHGLETADFERLREEEGIPELEDEEDKISSNEMQSSEDSEDGFDDEPSADTLVRKFENRNRIPDPGMLDTSPVMPFTKSVASEVELLNGGKSNSPNLSPLRATSSVVALPLEIKNAQVKEDGRENKVVPMDLFSSMKEIEALFIKASDSGQEVPRMLEANKLHFRPIIPAKEGGTSIASTFLKACFSCGEDPSIFLEEPARNSVKYLTWHRTASSRSSSSRKPLGPNSKDEAEDFPGDMYDNFCMISGSHASTLDRLHAWERKLYDEVKASEMVRGKYDMKRKLLRQQESRGASSQRIDKTRANVKDLHSRIIVAIHRIDSISKRIEELRDKELQPQLEELIEGLHRMWEDMLKYHKLQFQIISVAYASANTKISIQSESRRQITVYLESELSCLSSSFMKWIGAQRSYLQAINGWLNKCVIFPEKSKKKRRVPAPPLRNYGPPIYVTCGVWLDMLEKLPTKEVADAAKSLAAETTSFLPRQEKNQGKGPGLSWKTNSGDEATANMLRDEASEDWNPGLDSFRSSLAGFLDQLSNFSECSEKMYGDLKQSIQNAKAKYGHVRSPP
ncbi:protein of unknown function DUF630 [Dillenia turbinata]|uniref:DUF632 domain-containing protein n=1 Tax=Dillenia turbinata TaxID=194707 RepID=A0AAN8VV06_9MAGN